MAPCPLQTPSYRFRTGVAREPRVHLPLTSVEEFRLVLVMWVIAIGGSVAILIAGGVL